MEHRSSDWDLLGISMSTGCVTVALAGVPLLLIWYEAGSEGLQGAGVLEWMIPTLVLGVPLTLMLPEGISRIWAWTPGSRPARGSVVGCSWCGTVYERFQPDCDRCGGPMPPPPGSDAGPAPGPEPRPLPRGYARRFCYAHNWDLHKALPFAMFGAFLTGMLWLGGVTPFAVVFALLMLLPALVAVFVSVDRRQRVLQALVEGDAVTGTIQSVSAGKKYLGQDVTLVGYTFNVERSSYHGEACTLDPSMAQRRAGQPLHVVYLPYDPGCNTIYPPPLS